MANSPCINAGAADGVPNEQHDRDGELRIQQGQVDIGSDEWLDSDDDDLPDWWEKLYFDDPESAEPFGDDDEDGVDSLGEYESGRDPGWEPQAYYVTLVGDDVWDGLSPIWDGIHGPKATIQAAIDTCHPYEGDEVVIASGAFKGEGNKNLDFKGKAITLRSTSKDPNLCIIDCESSGRGFNFHSGEGQNSIVSGLTIANGLVVGSGRGGGVYCRVRSSPMLSNCIIKDCDAYYGGGLHCHDDCNPTLVNCTITGNSSSYGGGVYCYRSKVALFNCIVAENSTGSGGGIYCTSSEPIVADSTITGNSAVYGGGAYCDSKLNLSNCQVMGNTATEEGGGVYLTSHSLLSNCTISGNSATKGGGVYSYLNDPTISYCTIVENSATIGGGVCSNVSDLTLLNCLISGNTTRDNGGGIYCSGSQPSFINCTVAANSAGLNGGGVYCKICYLTLNNCIVSSNFPDAVSVSSGNPIITHCAVESGTGQSWFGAGCIDADPRFVDPDGPDDDPNTWQDNDYRLQPDSPCIDAGNNATVPLDTFDLDNDGDPNEPLPVDLDGLRRFFDDPSTPDTGLGEVGDPIVDMGAYEFGAAIAPGCVGDLNCDGVVNAFDIDPFIIALLQPAQYEILYPDCNRLHADAQANGLVNAFDIDPFIETLLAGGSGHCP